MPNGLYLTTKQPWGCPSECFWFQPFIITPYYWNKHYADTDPDAAADANASADEDAGADAEVNDDANEDSDTLAYTHPNIQRKWEVEK